MTIPDPIACVYLFTSNEWGDDRADHTDYLGERVAELVKMGYRRVLIGRVLPRAHPFWGSRAEPMNVWDALSESRRRALRLIPQAKEFKDQGVEFYTHLGYELVQPRKLPRLRSPFIFPDAPKRWRFIDFVSRIRGAWGNEKYELEAIRELSIWHDLGYRPFMEGIAGVGAGGAEFAFHYRNSTSRFIGSTVPRHSAGDVTDFTRVQRRPCMLNLRLADLAVRRGWAPEINRLDHGPVYLGVRNQDRELAILPSGKPSELLTRFAGQDNVSLIVFNRGPRRANLYTRGLDLWQWLREQAENASGKGIGELDNDKDFDISGGDV